MYLTNASISALFRRIELFAALSGLFFAHNSLKLNCFHHWDGLYTSRGSFGRGCMHSGSVAPFSQSEGQWNRQAIVSESEGNFQRTRYLISIPLRSVFPRPCLIDPHRAAFNSDSVERLYRVLGLFVIGHGDKGEPFGTPRIPVHDYIHSLNTTELSKNFAQCLFVYLVRQVSYVYVHF